jgi:hypothetical protein
MASHLGRNPFQSKKEQKKPTLPSEKKPEPSPPIESVNPNSDSSLSESLLVRVPAASFMIALKTTLWVKEKLERKTHSHSKEKDLEKD